MGILELITIVSGSASIVGGVDVIRKHFTNSTPEDLFKKSFVDAVKQIAPRLARLVDIDDPKTIKVDQNTLDQVLASLKDFNTTELVSLDKNEKLLKVTELFQKCIIWPGNQFTTEELVQRLQPVIESTITNFYDRLPRNQQAANQIMLEYDRMQLKGQKHLSEANLSIRGDIQELDTKVTDLPSKYFDMSVSAAVEAALEKEYQLTINKAKDLLKNYKPKRSLDLLEDLKQRKWIDASDNLKFNILTNMAAAHFELNNEQEAAKLLIEAFQYHSEDEKALSNLAFAYFLLGNMENAADYAKQTLKKNPANINAHVVLIHISSKKEPFEKVIAQVPDYLQETPEITHAFSRIVKEHGDLEGSKKWCEITVAQKQGNVPAFKAAFATILINQVLEDSFAVGTRQLTVPQKQQLRQAIELLTEAWDSISKTELKEYRTDWIINRGTAHFHLGEIEEATADLETALSIGKPNPVLLKNRALLALECGEKEIAIEFLEKIQSASEVPEAPIMLANMLSACERYDEAITKLTDFIKTDPSSELQNDANYFLVGIYIAAERFDEAKQILTSMLESSPTNVLNLINAAMISSKTGKRDEAISQLKKACNYVQDSENLHEKLELADQLYIHDQFKEAATLYEKLTDTSQNSQLTVRLLASYYNSGEIGKALEICQELREKYGPLKNISEREVMIYEEIGDMNQAETVCKEYLNKFTTDYDMRIRLGMVLCRSNKMAEVDDVLESFPDSKNCSFVKNLSLEACVQFAQLHQIRLQPEKALKIMYEVRRTHFDKPDAHLRYIGIFFLVENEIPEVLSPTQVQKDTVVQIDCPDESVSYIIVDRDDVNIERKERDINDTFTKQLLGKRVGDEVDLGRTPLGKRIGKITDIKSKYIYACQESFQKFPELFPGDEGLWSVKTDSTNIQPILEFTNKQCEASLQIENRYKEHQPPIGVFMGWTRRNALDAWNLLINKPDLGIKCCIGSAEERARALALLNDPKPKLVADLISLTTLYFLGAADTVVKVFGKLCIAQSTIDELLQIIHEREGMWSQREGMSIEKQGNRYVRHMINPKDIRRNVERLKDLIKWIRENCEVIPCTAALQMNQLRKRELDDAFQRLFIDTLLIASQTGHLLLSDDALFRTYAETNFNSDAGTNFQIDGVWTQVVLEHCLNQNVLDKNDYDKMTIQLVCSHYYHTEFGTDVLMEALKQANWNLAEPYNRLVQALGGQKMNLQKALNVAVDFLFEIWEEQIPYNQLKFVTLGLLAGLTSGRDTHKVLSQLEYLIQNKHILFFPIENRILRQIEVYELIYPFERNFDFLSEDDIRIKGTRIGIETILYESLHLSQTPEEIVERYATLTLEEVYATILYYLQNSIKIGSYLANNLEYCQRFREEYEKNHPSGVIRLRQLKAERENVSDRSSTDIPKSSSTITTPSSSKKEQE